MTKRETNRETTQYSKEKPFAKGVYHRTQMYAHTPGVPGSRHQQHWAGGCVCGLHSRSSPSASLSPTPPPALS